MNGRVTIVQAGPYPYPSPMTATPVGYARCSTDRRHFPWRTILPPAGIDPSNGTASGHQTVLMRWWERDMLFIMRTTISLDDQLAKQVRQAAKARGISVSAFIAMTLDDALKRREMREPPPFHLVTVRGVHARPGVDLDQPRALDALDDKARFGRGSG